MALLTSVPCARAIASGIDRRGGVVGARPPGLQRQHRPARHRVDLVADDHHGARPVDPALRLAGGVRQLRQRPADHDRLAQRRDQPLGFGRATRRDRQHDAAAPLFVERDHGRPAGAPEIEVGRHLGGEARLRQQHVAHAFGGHRDGHRRAGQLHAVGQQALERADRDRGHLIGMRRRRRQQRDGRNDRGSGGHLDDHRASARRPASSAGARVAQAAASRHKRITPPRARSSIRGR